MNATYRYAVTAGIATNAWSATFVFTDAATIPTGGEFSTTIIEAKIWDNPMYIRFAYDGVTFGDPIELDPADQPMQIPHSARAFQVMNVTAGVFARYQVIGYTGG